MSAALLIYGMGAAAMYFAIIDLAKNYGAHVTTWDTCVTWPYIFLYLSFYGLVDHVTQ